MSGISCLRKADTEELGYLHAGICNKTVPWEKSYCSKQQIPAMQCNVHTRYLSSKCCRCGKWFSMTKSTSNLHEGNTQPVRSNYSHPNQNHTHTKKKFQPIWKWQRQPLSEGKRTLKNSLSLAKFEVEIRWTLDTGESEADRNERETKFEKHLAVRWHHQILYQQLSETDDAVKRWIIFQTLSLSFLSTSLLYH